MPGRVAMVVRGGQVVYQRCTGLADVEHGAPNNPDTEYHLASVSKQFASFAVALLERAGQYLLFACRTALTCLDNYPVV